MRERWKRPSRLAHRDRRWPALRLEALRRDGWKCTKCGSKVRLEVHHVQPVRTHPELAFALANLAVLCAQCHTKETRRELGLPSPNPERLRWQALVRQTRNPKSAPRRQ